MLKSLKQHFKQISLFKVTIWYLRTLRNSYSCFTKTRLFAAFINDYRSYRALPANQNFILKTADLYPRIYDKTTTTPLDPVYFYQDTWCAQKIFEARPATHVDVGSKADLVGVISKFTPTTMVDIRPLPLSLPELSFIEGSILALPFKEGSISSLSSICVIEHIGLGRYGDPLDPFGSEKAFAELIRVLAPHGDLYISVPIDTGSKVYFNAHRAFSRDHMLRLAQGLTLVEERYIYGNQLKDSYDEQRGFGTGLFHFRKQ